jgi:hypothetical protein
MIRKTEVPQKPMGDEPVYDYSAIESLEEFKTIADGATLIFMVDKNEVIYGKELLRAIATKVMPPQGVRPLAFAVDYASDQREHLLTAVQTVKGFHEGKTK